MTHRDYCWLGVAGMLGVAFAANAAQTLEPGVDRPGGDLRPGFELPAPDPALCRQACDREPACKGYTYVKPGVQGPSARCWLKAEVRPAVKNDCCVSGVRVERNPAVVTQPPAGLTPIQLPGPQAPGASAAVATMPGPLPGPGAAAATAPPPPPPPPSLSKPAQTAAVMSRQAMIETLAANPATRVALEQAALAVGTTIEGLASSVTGSPAATVDSGPAPQALLDLWKAPVHVSPTLPGPPYAADDASYVAAAVEVSGIYGSTKGHTLQSQLEKDVLELAPKAYVGIYLDLPPGGGQYVVAVRATDFGGKAWTSSTGSPSPINVIGGQFRSRVGGVEKYEPAEFVPNSDNTALVAMFTENAANQGCKADKSLGLRRCSMMLELYGNPGFVYFAGVTVTRL